MKSADCAASDGDEHEREELPLDDRGKHFASHHDCLRRDGVDERHLDQRIDQDDPDDEQTDGADLEVAREVVAGAEEHPDREHAGGEAVNGDRVGEGVLRELQVRAHRAVLHGLTEDERQHEQHHADHGGFADAADRPAAHLVDVEAHPERDGNREPDGEHAPG